MSKEIAKILVDIKSINFSFDKYFTLTSGLASPVYVDCRKIISFTKERNFIIDKAIDYLTKNNIETCWWRDRWNSLCCFYFSKIR